MSELTQEGRQRQVMRNLPQLFETHQYHSVLYVGANQRRQHFVDWFESSKYEKIVILEAFKDNFEFLRAKFGEKTDSPSNPFNIIHGDIRNVDSIFKEKFDVVFFWHGIEHLHQEEIKPTLKKLERMCKVIVLGLPCGIYEQGPEYGNPFEEHLSAIYPEYLQDLGYKTDVLGKPDQRGSNIMAWKILT